MTLHELLARQAFTLDVVTDLYDDPRERLRAFVQALAESHEPPRNSGEGDAVDGPTPLAGGDERHTAGA